MGIKVEEGIYKCSYCDFVAQEKDNRLAAFAIVRHERDEHPDEKKAKTKTKPPKGQPSAKSDPEDVSEMGTRFAVVLSDNVSNMRESSRRALLMDFDQQLDGLRTREQLIDWLEKDYHDVLNPGQIRRVARAMFPGSSRDQGTTGGVSGVSTMNIPGLGPVIVLNPQDRYQQQSGGPHIIQVGGAQDEGDKKAEARMDKLEAAMTKLADMVSARQNTGPPMRRRAVPQVDETGEPRRDRSGEVIFDMVEEPYDPQEASFFRLMTAQQRWMGMFPKQQGTGISPEDIRRAAKEATEPLQKQVEQLGQKIELDRARLEAEEAVREREVKPLLKEVNQMRQELDESRKTAGLPAAVSAQLERQDRLLKRGDRMFDQATEYINLQNLRQMGVSPEHLAEIYRARRAKGQVGEDEWADMALKVRR